jgi:hypothetical protein
VICAGVNLIIAGSCQHARWGLNLAMIKLHQTSRT